ncbi:MAG: carboxypeptidase regulatory-like domain-containing protein [Gemmatimonadaceae bacterium]
MRSAIVAAASALVGAASLRAQAPQLKPASPAFMLLVGTVMDSIHNVPLAKATVSVVGTNRSTVTNADGEYKLDSIPPGTRRVVVTHPLLDTIGRKIITQELPFAAGEAHSLDLYTPSGEEMAASTCNKIMRSTRGPAVMLGFVKDPDTGAPVVGAKVSLVYYETDIVGRKQLRAPGPVTDSTGRYSICGLPPDMSGKVQVFRNGVSSGEVPVEVKNMVAVRGFTVAGTQVVAEVKGDSGKIKRVAKGTARVSGIVVDKQGKPLVGARVALQGGGIPAITGSGGVFVLDSLPSGTQALEVRKLGYAAADVPVELSAAAPARKNITLDDFVPTLAVMRVEAQKDKALSDVGYLSRKQTGLGFFMDGNQINHASSEFSEVMRMAPGLRVQPSGDGRTNVITDSRSSSTGCVNIYVDGSPWQSMTPGDIDGFIRPDEMVAVEVYHGSNTPPQYTTPGQSSCAAIVVWTVARIHPDNKSKKP